jgi:hypothetical protein
MRLGETFDCCESPNRHGQHWLLVNLEHMLDYFYLMSIKKLSALLLCTTLLLA